MAKRPGARAAGGKKNEASVMVPERASKRIQEIQAKKKNAVAMIKGAVNEKENGKGKAGAVNKQAVQDSVAGRKTISKSDRDTQEKKKTDVAVDQYAAKKQKIAKAGNGATNPKTVPNTETAPTRVSKRIRGHEERKNLFIEEQYSVKKRKTAKEALHPKVNAPQPAQPQEPFRFMDLVPELRIIVYRHALVFDKPVLLDEPAHTRLSTKWSAQPDGRWLEDITFRDGSYRWRYHDDPPQPTICPINVPLLRACKLVYKEAHKILYGENTFEVRAESGAATFKALPQSTRRAIKRVTLTFTDIEHIIERFPTLARIGLRYCFNLERCEMVMDVALPNEHIPVRMDGGPVDIQYLWLLGLPTERIANAFEGLRWLSRGCEIVMERNDSKYVELVIARETKFLKELNVADWSRRQHQPSWEPVAQVDTR